MPPPSLPSEDIRIDDPIIGCEWQKRGGVFGLVPLVNSKNILDMVRIAAGAPSTMPGWYVKRRTIDRAASSNNEKPLESRSSMSPTLPLSNTWMRNTASPCSPLRIDRVG